MKFKRLFLVLLISFMLLSVPCAYASDSNTDEKALDVSGSELSSSSASDSNTDEKALDVSGSELSSSSASDSNTDEKVNNNLQDVKINNVAKAAINGINDIIDMNSPTNNIDKDKKSDNVNTEDLKKEIAECEGRLSKIDKYLRINKITIDSNKICSDFYRYTKNNIYNAKYNLRNNNNIGAEQSISIAKKQIRSIELSLGIKSTDLKERITDCESELNEIDKYLKINNKNLGSCQGIYDKIRRSLNDAKKYLNENNIDGAKSSVSKAEVQLEFFPSLIKKL